MGKSAEVDSEKEKKCYLHKMCCQAKKCLSVDTGPHISCKTHTCPIVGILHDFAHHHGVQLWQLACYSSSARKLISINKTRIMNGKEKLLLHYKKGSY